MQDKKPDVPVSDESNLVIVATPEYVKEAIAEHAASRNHPNATLQDKGFVVLSNDVGSDSETMSATPKAVKTTYDLANIANQLASNANNNANTRLAKSQNGDDIPNKVEFVNNLGLRNTVDRVEETNLGKTHTPRTKLKSGEWGKPVGYSALIDGNSTGIPVGLITHSYWHIIGARDVSEGYGGFLAGYNANQIYYGHALSAHDNPTWCALWTTSNTHVDNGGIIRKISPVIQIYSSGKFTTNEESDGTNVERQSKGTYLIRGVMGFCNDGAIGSVEIPRCQNDLPLIWVNHKVLPDGSIKLMTYHREHSDAPAFARNIREGYADGDLIDIPDGRFVSVRVQMPDTK